MAVLILPLVSLLLYPYIYTRQATDISHVLELVRQALPSATVPLHVTNQQVLSKGLPLRLQAGLNSTVRFTRR